MATETVKGSIKYGFEKGWEPIKFGEELYAGILSDDCENQSVSSPKHHFMINTC